MKNVKIKAFVHEKTNWDGEITYVIQPADISAYASDQICIMETEITVTIPSDDEIVSIKLEGLKKREERVRADYRENMDAVEKERDKLLALVHQK